MAGLVEEGGRVGVGLHAMQKEKEKSDIDR